MQPFRKLFEPGKIGRLCARNRVVMPPMGTEYCTPDGEVSQRQIDYYVERAAGGVGIIVVEAAYPRVHRGRLGLYDDRFIAPMRRLVDSVHGAGALVFCQVIPHRGRVDEHDPAAPSAIPHPYTKVMPRVVGADDIAAMEEAVARAVGRVKEAGFDGVMLHAGGGYLVADFLSPLVNNRTDRYGGDIEGRARFAVELVKVTKQYVGADYPLIFRLSADDRVGKQGFGIDDAIAVAIMLEEAGVNAIDVISGSAAAPEWVVQPMYMPIACNTPFSAAIKRRVKIPVIVAGKIVDPFVAEEVLEQGWADFVDMGRALICDPQVLVKAIDGRASQIRKCIGCLRCSESTAQHHVPVQCSVNPASGKEREFASRIGTISKRKRVLVIGGGPAGMQSAAILARKGHDVTLWEATGELGGSLKMAALPPGKDILNDLLAYLKGQLDIPGVKVELGTRATVPAVEAFAPEAVVYAAGSVPFTPGIPGVNLGNVFNYNQVLNGERQTGHKVVVIGGGLIGCETADFLAARGKSVTMAFFEPEPVIVFTRLRRVMVKMLEDRAVRMISGVQKFNRITSAGVELVDRDGRDIFLEADNVVIAAGSRPNKALAQSLRGRVAELYEVGDCVEPRRILEAIHEGTEAALQI